MDGEVGSSLCADKNTGSGTGLCLEVHDLAISKLVAGREKDLEFLLGLSLHKMISLEILKARLESTSLADERKILCEGRLQRLFGQLLR